jgi:cytoskeletal protein CcmA (bactofilin family)
MSVETTSEVGGSLVVGSGGLHLGDDVELGVGVDLRVAGPLEGTLATLRVERNASVGGRIDLTSLYVAGTLTQTAGAERRITGTSQLGGDVDGEVTVPAPCDCADASLFDTAAFVADNASSALALPNADGGVQTPRCASFALPDGEVDDVHITLSEPAAIYVPGDLHTTGDLAIDSAAGAEIDLFIAGDVRIDGALHVGAASGQGPVRIYVGGGGTIQLSGGGELHGTLYAPKAELVLSAPLTLRGALFVRRVAASAELSVK